MNTSEARPLEPTRKDWAGTLDERVAAAVTYFAQSSSRRGFLAKLGKVALITAGVTLLPELLPADRRVANAADCGDWRLCGIYGRTCDCCNGGCGLDCCPSGSSWYGYWQSCCSGPFGSYWVLYWDCCNCSANCSSCTWCYGNVNSKGLWCNGGTYCCTAPVIGSEC